MIPENSTWHSQPTVIKGDKGEILVQEHLERLNYTCYKSVSDKPHPFDFEARRGEKRFYVEVKTKPRRRKYPDTGFNYRHYQVYKKVCEADNMRMFICFVDIELAKIYGNYLDVLDEERDYNGRSYPFNEPTKNGEQIRYFPMSAMKDVKILSDEEIKFLKENS